MLEVVLPQLPGGAAKLLRWLVADGAIVAQGAPLAIVLTERAEVLLPTPAAGTFGALVAEGATVEPGGSLGRLAQRVQAQSAKYKVTPLARSIAQAYGVELEALEGTGPGGKILAADVRAALAPPAPTPPSRPSPAPKPPVSLSPRPLVPLSPCPLVPLSPVATATFELDAGALLARVAEQRAGFAALGLPLGLAAGVVEAAAALLPAHPLLNPAWGEETIVLRRRVHVAVGEPGDEGLRWAVVSDAGDLTLRGVARAMARGGSAPLDGATFAVVCMEQGAGWHSAHPPLPNTAAALSVSSTVRRAVAVGAGVAVRPMAAMTLSYDARVLDHSDAARFLTALCDVLTHP